MEVVLTRSHWLFLLLSQVIRDGEGRGEEVGLTSEIISGESFCYKSLTIAYFVDCALYLLLERQYMHRVLSLFIVALSD